jgi:hypothetical protein
LTFDFADFAIATLRIASGQAIYPARAIRDGHHDLEHFEQSRLEKEKNRLGEILIAVPEQFGVNYSPPSSPQYFPGRASSVPYWGAHNSDGEGKDLKKLLFVLRKLFPSETVSFGGLPSRNDVTTTAPTPQTALACACTRPKAALTVLGCRGAPPS